MDTAHTRTQYTHVETRAHTDCTRTNVRATHTQTRRGTFLQATQKVSDPGQVGGFLEIP